MYVQYINLLDKSFRVNNVFLDEQEQIEFLSTSFSKEAFPNNIFSMLISKPKLLMPRSSCILCFNIYYILKRNSTQTRKHATPRNK